MCALAVTVNSKDRKVNESNAAAAATASSFTLEPTAVTKALSCLTPQDYTQAGIISEAAKEN